jgi:hypothetical protein
VVFADTPFVAVVLAAADLVVDGLAAVDLAAVVFLAATVFLAAVDFAAEVFVRDDVPVAVASVPDVDCGSPVSGASAAVSVVFLLAAGDTESLSLNGHGGRPRGNTPMTLSSPCAGRRPARQA